MLETPNIIFYDTMIEFNCGNCWFLFNLMLFMTMSWYEGNFYDRISGQCCFIWLSLHLHDFLFFLFHNDIFFFRLNYKFFNFYEILINIFTFCDFLLKIQFSNLFFTSLSQALQSNLFYQICNFYSHSHHLQIN